MDKYISCETAKADLQKAFAFHDYAGSAACSVIDKIPAADVVEIVRCGACKHRTSGDPNCVGRSKDWYCPLGERRDDDNAEQVY